jgi:sugar O-acyltransferase (sialic acid O-acetyltransferase NeuD family)
MNEILTPKVGTSDSKVKILNYFVENGGQVNVGDLLCELETSKTTYEFFSELNGFVYLIYPENTFVEVGSVLLWVSNRKIDEIELNTKIAELTKSNVDISKRVVTRKAEKLIELNNLNVENFTENFIDEKLVFTYLNSLDKAENLQQYDFNSNDVVIVGIGGHAGMCIDIINENSDLNLVGFLDDTQKCDNRYNLKFFGGLDKLNVLHKSGLKNIVLGIGFVGQLSKRKAFYEKWREFYNFPTIIHKSSIVESSAIIGQGCQLMAGSIVGSNVHISDNVIVNSGAIISHDCKISSNSHITPGAILAGHVNIGACVTIGMGVTIYIGLSISDNKVVNNGENILFNI